MSQFFTALLSPFGELARTPYWLGLLVLFALFFGIFIVSDLQDFLLARGLGVVRLPIILIMVWCVFNLALKRLRDAGKNILWVLILFVPAINLLALLFFGTLQKNRHSANTSPT